MRHDFATDKAWENKHSAKVGTIIKSLLVGEATFWIDTKQATDFIVFRVQGGERKGQPVGDVAARVRRPGFFYDSRGYGLQFTIRSRRTSGAETELSKINKGWTDWLFYGHIEQEQLRHWMVIDSNIFRLWNGKVSFAEIDNQDGTYGAAFDIRTFPDETLIAASDTLKTAIEHGIDAVERLPELPYASPLQPPWVPPPDLQALVAEFGGYRKITPEAWARYDREMAEWKANLRWDLKK